MHLQKIKIKTKKNFDENYKIRTENFEKNNIRMFYNIRLNN